MVWLCQVEKSTFLKKNSRSIQAPCQPKKHRGLRKLGMNGKSLWISYLNEIPWRQII
jgi:hypothetical protein